MKVLAIDPGERVGWAHGVIGSDGHPGANYDDPPVMRLEVTGHGITALKSFALKLGQVFADYDVVVYERWALAGGLAKEQVGSEMPTSQLIGIIRYLSWIHPGVKCIGQWPAERDKEMKTLPPDHDLRRRIDDLPARHDDSHDRDALLHLWRFFWKRYV
jgi:hypothetical protein